MGLQTIRASGIASWVVMLHAALVPGCGAKTHEASSGDAGNGGSDLHRAGDSWLLRVGGSSTDIAFGMAPGPSSGVVVSGAFTTALRLGQTMLSPLTGFDIFVLHVDANGDVRFATQAGASSSNQYHCAVACGPAHPIVAVGTFAGSIAFGGAPLAAKNNPDTFLARIADGTPPRIQSLGRGSVIDAPAVASGASGTVVVAAGGQIVELNDGGEVVWSQPVGTDANAFALPLGVALAPSGEVAVVGTFAGSVSIGGATVAAATDVFVAKLAPDGSVAWLTKAGGGPGRAHVAAGGVQFTADGSVVVVAPFSDGACFGDAALDVTSGVVSIAELNSDGRPRWCRAENGPFASVAVRPTGNVVALGTGALVEFDDLGSVSRRMITGADFGDAVVVDDAGNTYIAGRFGGTLNVGPLSTVSAGAFDVYIAKLASTAW